MTSDELKAAAQNAIQGKEVTKLYTLDPAVPVSHGQYKVHADMLDERGTPTAHIVEFSQWLYVSNLQLGH